MSKNNWPYLKALEFLSSRIKGLMVTKQMLRFFQEIEKQIKDENYGFNQLDEEREKYFGIQIKPQMTKLEYLKG